MNFSSFDYFQSYLDSLGLFSIQLGLKRMDQALGRLNLTRPKAPVVHVVGTNGKGSTSGFLEAMARAHGLRTGLYTSPHLVQVRERIRINGRMLPETTWMQGANAVLSSCDVGLTYFEVLTVMAIYFFEEAGLDLIIMEAGLGGTHDATCAISADLTIMTPVALDHEQILGPTLKDIARDKAGALGRCPAVTALQDSQVMDIFLQSTNGEPLECLNTYAQEQGFYFPGPHLAITPDILGEHPLYQVPNAALAVLAWSTLCTVQGWQFHPDVCTNVLGTTHFPGRFQQHGPVLVDGAHNTLGLQALCDTLEKRQKHFDVLVFQSMQDKVLDQSIFERLARLADMVLVPDLPHLERASQAQELAARFGHKGQVASSLGAALNRSGSILLCGSLYLVGEFYTQHPEYFKE